MATTELVFKIRTDSADFKSTMAQVRSELTQTGKTQSTVTKGELTMRQQLAAASSLQRQRSAALIGEWKRTETAAKNLTAGVRPLGESIRNLSTTVATLQGPLGGIAGRLSSTATLLNNVSAGSAAANSSMAALAGPVGLLIVGMAAAAVGVGLLGKALFDAAKQAADFQGKMFDLSQQTGVNVETLSALEILATTTGGSIESIAQSLVIFQGKLDEAQDATSKAAKQLRDLGIETNNTEQAFRQALTVLSRMPEGFHQTNQAAELFGRRGGKQVLAILKETKGDLDGTIRRFRELGIVISTADAKAADEFNDQLALLNFQLRALGAVIGKEVIPHVLRAIKQFSEALKNNEEAIKAVAEVTGQLAAILENRLSIDIGIITTAWNLAEPVLRKIAELYERIATAIGLIKPPDFSKAIGGAKGSIPVGPLPVFTDLGLQGRIAVAESDAHAKKELEALRHLTETIELEHEKRGGDLERFYARRQQVIDENLKILTEQIARERAAFEAAGVEPGIEAQAEADKRNRELDQRETQARNRRDEETRKLTLEKNRAELQEEIQHRTQVSQIAESARKGELARTKAALDRQAIAESEALTVELAQLRQAQAERIGIIDFELNHLTTTAERKAELDTEKTISEQQFTDEVKRLIKERIDARNRETLESAGPGEVEIGQTQVDIGTPPPALHQLGTFAEELERVSGLSQQTSQIIGETLAGAFSELANAVGLAVQSFVLFGKVEGGFRKFAAELIASIAATAAVQAVYQLAQGLAWLALNFFFPNPAYARAAATAFTSAAVFGSIAGVAAVAGRGIAGNAFSGAGGGGGGTSGSGQLNPLTFDRNRAQPTQHIVIHVNDSEFGRAITAHVVRNVQEAGPIREVIANDGAF